MAIHRKCANSACKGQTRLKYRYCTDCRRESKVYVSDPNTFSTTTPVEDVEGDRIERRSVRELASWKQKYTSALDTIDRLEREARTRYVLEQNYESFTIVPKEGQGTSEATPVLVASDWHVEEIVGAEVGGLNTYNPNIAEARATTFFQAGLRLIRLLHQDVHISTVVLALLGDFITNDIHDGMEEKNELQPAHAIVFAQRLLISGLEFLLNQTPYSFTIPCHSGNHARTTAKTRFGSENGHSLEYLMYLSIAAYFRDEPRLTFLIPDGMHSYLKVYDQTIRFHHGHAIKYQGGVGGIYIPTNKAIAQWNKGRAADLDVFGHFHQLRDGGNFICNGSMIGMNAFALSIKADYEKPKQALFLLDKKRGRTAMWPILF